MSRDLDHPLVGTIARRLIWTFTRQENGRAPANSGAWLEAKGPGERDGRSTRRTSCGTPSAALDEVLAWREWLERHEVRQPFKQAHREVYLLTDAERRTRHLLQPLRRPRPPPAPVPRPVRAPAAGRTGCG